MTERQMKPSVPNPARIGGRAATATTAATAPATKTTTTATADDDGGDDDGDGGGADDGGDGGDRGEDKVKTFAVLAGETRTSRVTARSRGTAARSKASVCQPVAVPRLREPSSSSGPMPSSRS